MKSLLALSEIAGQPLAQVGGKAFSLARLSTEGFTVPRALCLSVAAYRRYLRATGVGEQIGMELGRKDFAAMRWEELWDTALRIRHLFLAAPLPKNLAANLTDEVRRVFGDVPLVVRSSAPGEDSKGASFAGLHESLVNVCGRSALCDAVRKVWASLWSDRALLYRQELGLDVRRSAMAVLIQEMVAGEKSGVAFSRSPTDAQRTVVEAVWGLNQGLVDGSIEPDHWEIDRRSGALLQFRPAQRQQAMRPIGDGVRATDLDAAQANSPPLTDTELQQVATLARRLEALCGQPQDVEWTFAGGGLLLLQARAVTARKEAAQGDQRGWFLSLHRSVITLQQLRRRIESEVMPGMEGAAAKLAMVDPAELHDTALAAEIEARRGVLREWEEVYRRECIPMAHGVRLFGEYYNDQLRPADPFEFVRLLQGAGMRAVVRNRQLVALAGQVRNAPEWQQALSAGTDLPAPLNDGVLSLTESTGLAFDSVGKLLLELAQKGSFVNPSTDPDALQEGYLAHFEPEQRPWAAELLELGRASYRLRDDDNLSLDQVRRQVRIAEGEGRRRLAQHSVPALQGLGLDREEEIPPPASGGDLSRGQVRQIQGQPAGPGVAAAPARVINNPQDLAAFQAGEVLVCDAIDPAMTFIVPLAAAIVERRGGMLIHGAIIAREYGLPCVTGISDAAAIIRTGDRVTVDGYLGIVVIDRA
ncbi:MAG: PEP/pyruvate-binding domain-containing protein [Syntrophotaleaceae bacterium]